MNEQMKKLEAVKSRCNTLAKVVGIVEKIFIVITIIVAAIGLIMIIGRNKINPALEEGISQGYVNFDMSVRFGNIMGIDNITNQIGDYALGIGITCLFAALAVVFVVIVLAFIKKIFTIIKEENSPFSEKCLKTIKFSFIVITVTSCLGGSLGVTLMTGFVLFCIYSVFEYGAALQTEIDETL